VLIVNTCGFIHPAKEESIKVIFEACELKSLRQVSQIIVTGCLSERYMDALEGQIGEVDYFFGVESAEEIAATLLGEGKSTTAEGRHLLTPKHYAYMKIAEGCNHKCSFCAIPLIKGGYRSRPVEELLGEANMLAAKGVRELNLIAQDTTYYGRDISGKSMTAELLRRLSDNGLFRWIRLLYAYPAGFPEDVLDIMAERDDICNYIDIPLQHASGKILRSMGRAADRQQLEKLINNIRDRVPGVAIRTAFIVGYPGENMDDFHELKQFVADMQFDRMGVFTYSHEEDTPAFVHSDTVPEEVKQARMDELMQLQQQISYKKNKNIIGKNIEIIIDENVDGKYYGRTSSDAPEIDNAVVLRSGDAFAPGDFVRAGVIDATEYDLIAKS
jgi:ribosomal protein S12 methylthiotransferase